jgi:hypothetical protein
MAGIDNFQPSDLNISLQSFLNRESELDLDAGALEGRLCVVAFSILEYAIMKEIEPLRSSTISTAVPAEYASDGAADTLE